MFFTTAFGLRITEIYYKNSDKRGKFLINESGPEYFFGLTRGIRINEVDYVLVWLWYINKRFCYVSFDSFYCKQEKNRST